MILYWLLKKYPTQGVLGTRVIKVFEELGYQTSKSPTSSVFEITSTLYDLTSVSDTTLEMQEKDRDISNRLRTKSNKRPRDEQNEHGPTFENLRRMAQYSNDASTGDQDPLIVTDGYSDFIPDAVLISMMNDHSGSIFDRMEFDEEPLSDGELEW